VEPNLARARQLVLELMAIPGRSGEELPVANYVRERLVAAGALEASIKTDNAHTRSPLKGNVGNLIMKLPGTVRGPRRLLTAHLDTVPLCVGCQPKVQGNFVRSANPATALGADNRAGTAAILVAALELFERKLPHPPLTFCWFVQEEVGLNGARYMQQNLLGKPAMGFNWDGGAPNKVTIGATGGYRMDITIAGLASHAGIAPEKGVSAIAIAAIAIADLQRNGWHGLVEKGGKRGTTNVGVIQGGDATNVVTDLVRLRAEARSHDKKFRERIVREIEKAFERAAKEVRSTDGKRGSVTIDGRLDYEAFALDGRSDAVRLSEEAVRDVGLEPVRAISNGGLDANWINAHGIPTVTLGCGQMDVHTTSEQLDLKAFENSCRIALRLATAGAA
jgi:tripeptide aminopeptidase